jgi:hypothetical protein
MKTPLLYAMIAIATLVQINSAPHAQASPASTIHVNTADPAASDDNPGTEALPVKTINRAVQVASGHPANDAALTVLVHRGIYRELVTVTRSLTLVALPGAEIRGSDVWSTGWTHANRYWTHAGLPRFHAHGSCEGWKPCLWPEQVFYDGKPLGEVVEAPSKGQFAVTPDRVLVLADPPAGHTVEVTVRTGWVTIRSNGVIVTGFTMRHSANDAQTGAIGAEAYSNVGVMNNVLSDAHGAVLSLSQGRALRVIGNDISRGGQLGVHLFAVTDSLIQSNRIHENNTMAFNSGWEAGGLKASRATHLTVDANEVYGNDGPGLWCDGDCQDVVFSNNRIHHNSGQGIQYEISHTGRIFNNVVWKNGLAYGLGTNHWGWGAGILVQNSNGCEVFRNTLAWNSNGIVVLEQERGPAYLVFNTSIHNNTIISQDAQAEGIVYSLAWLSDYPTKMFTPSQNNTASSNRYGYSGVGESVRLRFAWGGSYGRLVDFGATPGGKGGSYLTLEQQNSVLSAAQVTESP